MVRVALVVSGALAVSMAGPSRAPIGYRLDETVALQRGWTVVTYRDLDGDARPDLVVTTGDHRRIEIHERRGEAFVAVASLATPATVISFDTIGDVDRDGALELVLRGRRSGELYVVEARGDDRYELTRFPVAPIDDPTCIADTDGDGRREIVATQPGFPSRVHRFEAVGDDRYERLPTLDGVGGSVFLACALVEHAGPLRLVFADTHFWRGVHRGAWLDASGAQGTWPRLGFTPAALADTDGDGRVELLGRDDAGGLVIADLADRGAPRVVLRDPDATCAMAPGDYDGDGRIELLCTPVIDGLARVQLRARRGDRLVTIWDGSALLPASSAPLRARPAGDWNGDGRLELLVTRGGPSPRLYVLDGAAP